MQTRRQLLKNVTTLSLAGLSSSVFAGSTQSERIKLADTLLTSESASEIATNEAYWKKVADYYDKGREIINLEQGYWGKMALPVEAEYIRLTKKVKKTCPGMPERTGTKILNT